MHEKMISALGAVIREEQDHLGERVMGVIQAAISFSERGVMAASDSVRAINEEARQQVDELRGAAEQSLGERQLTERVLDEQKRFCTDAMARLKRQAEAAQRCLHLVQEIKKLAEGVNRISEAARMLTINGQIESARVGSEGAGFRVIASELRELSRTVRDTNDSIQGLAAGLIDLIPGIAAGATSLLGMMERFSSQQVSLVSELESAATAAQHAMAEVVAATQERAARVVSRSGEILSRLGFQDCMAQDLSDVEGLLRQNAALLQALLQRIEASGQDLDVAAALEEIRPGVPLVGSRLGQRPGDVTTGVKKGGKLLLL